MHKNITWSNFEAIHSNPRDSFEQLCRILFKRQFLDEISVLTSSPNHPGVEATPIFSQKLGKQIAFQSKFFQNNVDYSQIQKSVVKTVKNYSDSLDIFYLYCNKDLSLDSQSFRKVESTLNESNIDFEVISNNEILTEIVHHEDLQSFFFENHTISKEWFEEYNRLSIESLGNRYNPKLNVTTNADEKIQLFAKGQSAIDRINAKKVELIERLNEFYYFRDKTIIKKVKSCINSLEDVTVDNVEKYLDWNPVINDSLEDEIDGLFQMKVDLENQLVSRTDLDKSEQNHIHYKIRDIDNFIDYLYPFGCSKEEAALIQDKILIVTGEAGMGKSQLFATTVQQIMSEGGYALLLLGHHYTSSSDIRAQIIEKFGFNYGFQVFLNILDTMGETENKNIYIFIDAINETSDRNVWKNGLTGLISEVARRKHIKLVLSVRTGYENLVFEEKTLEKFHNGEILQIIHHGFRDESVKATKEFLDFYNIPFSPSDLLNYEMTNPLFLTLYCKTYLYNGEDLDLFKMFESFIAIVDDEIQNALNIFDSGRILKDLLLEVAKWQLEHDGNSINKKDFFQLEFWSDYGIQNKPYFLSYLLKSSLMLSFISRDEEVYSFGYNLLEDYLKAQTIKKGFSTKEQSKEYLKKAVLNLNNGVIANKNNIDVFLFACYFYYEKFNEDCIELIEKVSDENDCYDLANRYIKSFSWRPTHTLSSSLFRSIANHYPTDSEIVLRVLVENCTKEDSPINAEFLHEILFSKKLSERDGFWLPFINHLTYEDERVFQLISLFDSGAKIGGLSIGKTQLLLTFFSWLLSSSNRKLRDITSKAMIEILKFNFELCEFLLRKFEKINDPYVIQRLYGIVFGASVKKIKDCKNEFQSLAKFVYLSVFEKEFIYPDILLRDYARLIIERFLFEFPTNELEITKSKILPPYNSHPIPKVKQETYEKFDDNKLDGFTRIDNSMRPEGVGLYGDFGRYTFQAALTQFKEVDIENLYHYAMQFIRDELGYTSNECLSDYDSRMHHPLDRSGRRSVERIGKKYQWIAFYNILARISDYYKLREWDDVEDNSFKGPWEPYVRDFDPTLNYHTISPLQILPKFNIDYELEFIEQKLGSDREVDEWINEKPSLFNKPLSYKDSNEIEWVILHQHKELKYKPEEYVEDFLGFIDGEQRIWRIIKAYFIKNVEFDNLISNVRESKFLRSSISGGVPSYYQFFNREFGWSSNVNETCTGIAYDYFVETGEQRTERQKGTDFIWSDDGFKIVETEKDVIVNIKKLIAKLLPTHIHFLWEEEYDLSKQDTISFDIPCIELLSCLNLSQKEYDGYFYSSEDELIAFDGELTDTINGLIIRKDFLDKFLKDNGLSIIWDFVGEKQYFTQNPREQYYSRWEGVFWEEGHSMKNKIHIDDKRTIRDN